MRILVLGDTHFPFTNWDAITECAAFAKSYKPDLVIQVGDFIDAYNWSQYKRSADSPSAHDEWQSTLADIAKFQKLFKSFPMIILEGNHCRRIMMRANESNLPRQLIRNLNEIFPFENFTWHMSPSPLIRDNIQFIHGDELLGNAWQKAQRSGMSVVQGHDHIAYLQYINTFHKQIFGMSVGAFLDPNSIAGRYAAKNIMRMWTGFATVTDGVPALHPFG